MARGRPRKFKKPATVRLSIALDPATKQWLSDVYENHPEHDRFDGTADFYRHWVIETAKLLEMNQEKSGGMRFVFTTEGEDNDNDDPDISAT